MVPSGLRNVLIIGLACSLALIGWVLAGRLIVTFLDRFTRTVVDRPQVERLAYDGGTLEVGGRRLDLMSPTYDRVAEVSRTPEGTVILRSGGKGFRLGLVQSAGNARDMAHFDFAADQGDQVLLSVEHSRLAWPTPFEMNFMTGYSASRKRNVYVRLRWMKASGAKLEMLWKTEQGYYARDGWLPPTVEAIMSGLIGVDMGA